MSETHPPDAERGDGSAPRMHAWMEATWWAMWIPSLLDVRRILEGRFARGEIDEDEFRSRLALEGQR